MRPKSHSVTRLDYCPYLLVGQINYPLTNFVEHAEKFSHDAANVLARWHNHPKHATQLYEWMHKQKGHRDGLR